MSSGVNEIQGDYSTEQGIPKKKVSEKGEKKEKREEEKKKEPSLVFFRKQGKAQVKEATTYSPTIKQYHRRGEA